MPDLKATLEGNPPVDDAQPQGQVGEGSGEITDEVEEPSFVLDAFEQTNDLTEPDQDDTQAPVETPPVDAEAEQQRTQSAVQQPAPVENQQPAQVQPAQQPAQPAQQAADPNAQVSQAPAIQPVQGPDSNALNTLHQAIESKRDDYIKATASSLEATFTEDDINEFHDNPKVALSKMGARLHHDIVSNVLGLVAAKIPEVVSALMTTQTESKAREDAFFAEYPHLTAKRGDPTMGQIAAMVRQMNPQADATTFGRLLATMASTHFGIQPGQTQQAQQPARPQPRQVFTPAGGRQPAPSNPTARPIPGSPDYWGGLDEILQADDEGRLNGGAQY